MQINTQGTSVSIDLRFTKDQAAVLGSELGACILVQKTYGKQGGDDIAALMKIFIQDLKEFEPEDIIEAITECRKTQDDFVTPAAVRKILRPEPIFDYAVYQSLQDKKKRGDYLTQKEWAYMNAYEQNMMKGI